MTKKHRAQKVLAENCRRLRADLSQADIVGRAARHGYKIDQRTVSRLENPESANSTLNTIEAVATALGVLPWQLLIPDNVTQIPSSATPKARQILEVCRTLNDEGLTAVLVQAEFCGSIDKYKDVPSKQRKS
jgi:transcriptional regulator with XRE-family HTH domain